MLMTRVLLFAAVFMPVIATFVFCLTIIIVLCVYLKEHLKLAIQTAEDKQGMVELQEEGGPDEEEGERLSQKGSPYYERDKANLKVNPMYDQYGIHTKRDTMNFLMEMMPRDVFRADSHLDAGMKDSL